MLTAPFPWDESGLELDLSTQVASTFPNMTNTAPSHSCRLFSMVTLVSLVHRCPIKCILIKR
ncbi:hypothetical protein VKT23_011952 [Stygiomarasmius scandens]|uniref:Uncharacterized protein n=1 Tax=Marasmiellus scandens TaxID=2682957 RepID=A0ABR1JBG0_9AGAR